MKHQALALVLILAGGGRGIAVVPPELEPLVPYKVGSYQGLPLDYNDTMERVVVPDKLVTRANDPRIRLVMHKPVVVMAGDGRQPFLFCTSQGTLFCQAQLTAKPFDTKNKIVYMNRIGTAISRDGGATWMRWTHQENHDDVNIEGGAVQCADGTILLLDLYVVAAKRPDHGIAEVWKSHDDLHTVAGPFSVDFYLPTINFHASPTDDAGRVPPPAAPLHRSIVEMPNRDLLTTMYCCFAGDTAPSAYMPTMMKSRVVLVRSQDHGATWSYLATVAVDSGVGTEGFDEPVLVRVSQGAHAGRLVCLLRTGRELYGSHSDDGGVTWCRPLPVNFPGVDIYRTDEWENLFVDKNSQRYLPISKMLAGVISHGAAPGRPSSVPISEMIGAVVDPDLIEMRNGTLVCAFGVRAPARLCLENWRAAQNGDYLAFSFDGGDTWTHVVQFRAAAPTTHYIGVREIKRDLLYLVYDDSIWGMPGETLGFQLEARRADLPSAGN